MSSKSNSDSDATISFSDDEEDQDSDRPIQGHQAPQMAINDTTIRALLVTGKHFSSIGIPK